MTIQLDGPLVLAGAGKMGGALLTGWLAQGLPAARVIVQDPGPPPDIQAILDRAGIRSTPELGDLERPPAVLLLAVKPQIMEDVLPPLGRCVGPGTLVLSVAAGRTIASLERHLPAGTAVVRTIPNTPAAVGRGITVCVANAHVTPAQRALCDQLLGAVGQVGWVDDEGLIDVATAVSGSGPAYVFLLAEALAAAGVAAGLAPDLARRLGDATVAGAGELLHRSGEDPAVLRRNVTSPNGTTAAALAVLMADDGLGPLLTRAVAAAARRSRELSA
ncbi:MAG: pyrroline-5-carboxylate reductase [Hyphomicrobiaceae bacterium]|jgi:pyrroline-5-carboxylate reductase